MKDRPITMRVRAMVAPVHPRLFTVEEYYAMGEAGIFGPADAF